MSVVGTMSRKSAIRFDSEAADVRFPGEDVVTGSVWLNFVD